MESSQQKDICEVQSFICLDENGSPAFLLPGFSLSQREPPHRAHSHLVSPLSVASDPISLRVSASGGRVWRLWKNSLAFLPGLPQHTAFSPLDGEEQPWPNRWNARTIPSLWPQESHSSHPNQRILCYHKCCPKSALPGCFVLLLPGAQGRIL